MGSMAYREIPGILRDCNCEWNPVSFNAPVFHFRFNYANWTCCQCRTTNFDHEDDGNWASFCWACGHARDLVEGEEEPLARYIHGSRLPTRSRGLG